MNWLDIVIIIILVLTAFVGLRRGLIEMVFTLVGAVLAIFLAGKFYETVGSWLSFISNQDLANVLGFILILVVVLVLAFILAKIVEKAADIVLIGWVNRLGGALFAALLAAIIIAAILAIIIKYTGWNVASDSFMAKFFLDYFPLVLGLLPDNFEGVRDFFLADSDV